MAELIVQEMAGSILSVAYEEHNPVRSAHFASGSGTWSAAESIVFSPSGATAICISGSQSTHIVSFYLLTGTPALGDSVEGESGLFHSCDLLTSTGDTFRNDGRTLIYANNRGSSSVSVHAVSVGKCSNGFLHDLVGTVAPNVVAQIGPFHPSRFNTLGIAVAVYSGSTAPADLEVAAVRMFPINA